MPPQELPQILRVKRKRTDDPLQALVMETNRRQIKKPRYIFRLKRTEEKDIQDSTAVLTASSNLQNNKPVFNIPSKKKRNNSSLGADTENVNGNFLKSNIPERVASNNETTDTIQPTDDNKPQELNPELLEMLNDYLKNNDETTSKNPVKPPKRRQSSLSQELNSRPHFNKDKVFNSSAIGEENEEDEDSEYVYDVYYRDKAVDDQWKNEHIGYIRFDDDDLDGLNNDEDLTMNTDDEDSNDENFYRNDYPEDEDGGYDNESELASVGLGEPSDDQDDEFDIINDKRRFSKLDFIQNEGLKSISDGDYNELAEQIDEKPNYWDRKMYAEDEDGDENMDSSYLADDDNNFERNEFFQSDRDDPIAINRDRIFGKLQKMINEVNNQ